MTLKNATLTLVVACALALSGCASAQPGVVGVWGNPDTTSKPSLELGDNGELTGTDGCNRLMGSYTVQGDKITFEGVASTLMYCEGVDTWLSALASATVTGNDMTVFDRAGAEIGTLERAD